MEPFKGKRFGPRGEVSQEFQTYLRDSEEEKRNQAVTEQKEKEARMQKRIEMALRKKAGAGDPKAQRDLENFLARKKQKEEDHDWAETRRKQWKEEERAVEWAAGHQKEISEAEKRKEREKAREKAERAGVADLVETLDQAGQELHDLNPNAPVLEELARFFASLRDDHFIIASQKKGRDGKIYDFGLYVDPNYLKREADIHYGSVDKDKMDPGEAMYYERTVEPQKREYIDDIRGRIETGLFTGKFKGLMERVQYAIDQELPEDAKRERRVAERKRKEEERLAQMSPLERRRAERRLEKARMEQEEMDDMVAHLQEAIEKLIDLDPDARELNEGLRYVKYYEKFMKDIADGEVEKGALKIKRDEEGNIINFDIGDPTSYVEKWEYEAVLEKIQKALEEKTHPKTSARQEEGYSVEMRTDTEPGFNARVPVTERYTTPRKSRPADLGRDVYKKPKTQWRSVPGQPQE